MKLRSLLFVPADRPDRFPKALASGADALILDLEDSVDGGRKAYARQAVAEWLSVPRGRPIFVRVNSLSTGHVADDLQAILPGNPDGIVLPKAEGAASVEQLHALMGRTPIPILPIATETPAGIFQLGSYTSVATKLLGLTWGAEDLSSSVGAAGPRHADGTLTAPYELVRGLALFAAHACGVAAIETVYPALDDVAGLNNYLADARRDGFSAMMAIHPNQVPLINSAFTPSAQQREEAEAIVAAFKTHSGQGVLRLKGQMLDAPHLRRALRILDQTGRGDLDLGHPVGPDCLRPP